MHFHFCILATTSCNIQCIFRVELAAARMVFILDINGGPPLLYPPLRGGGQCRRK